MKVFLLLIIFSLFGINDVPAQKKYSTWRGDTLVEIKLLTKNRVILTEHPKQTLIEIEGNLSTNSNEKKICGMQTLTHYQSYGEYQIIGDKLNLFFKDENPIEKVEIKLLNIKTDYKNIKVKVNKQIDTYYDLKISQNNIELLHMLSFEEISSFSIDNIHFPLILEYNNNIKELNLPTRYNIELFVTINELKSLSYRKNQEVTFSLKQITESNKR